jgi:hypothetical protein
MAALGMLLGGGGLAAIWRMRAESDQIRSQSRVSERSQLTEEQVKFRADMAAELASLRTEITNLKAANQKLDERNDTLVKENGELTGRVRFLEEQNADLKNTVLNERAEKDAMKKRILELETSLRGIERRESAT